jgi:hypothetical protein
MAVIECPAGKLAERFMRFTIRDLLWLTVAVAVFCTGTQLGRHLEQPGADPREASIRAALDQKTDIEFVETPLKDAIDFIAEKHGIPVLLNAKNLEEAGVNVDTPVTKQLTGLTLRSTLNLLLDELELTYAVHNGVLMITTTAEAQKLQDTPFSLQIAVWLAVAVAVIWGAFLCGRVWRRAKKSN